MLSIVSIICFCVGTVSSLNRRFIGKIYTNMKLKSANIGLFPVKYAKSNIQFKNWDIMYVKVKKKKNNYNNVQLALKYIP